jgi:DNA modification methylase
VDLYIDHLVAVFREVKRVLRSDGTLWLNLGDCYWGSGGANNNSGITGHRADPSAANDERDGPAAYRERWGASGDLKAKDLVGIPWMAAFALRADGWYLRSDIIWAKPNPMTESVTDRCTKAHEYLFMLAKSPRYFYDAEEIREPSVGWHTTGQGSGLVTDRVPVSHKVKLPSGWDTDPGSHGSFHRNGRRPATRPPGCTDPTKGQPAYAAAPDRGSRNRRDVWTIATAAYKGAHFATFPPRLVEPSILAGCPVGGVVLDPFCGSGTTVAVAQSLGRRGIGFDLSMPYLRLAEQRVAEAPVALFGAGLDSAGVPVEGEEA